MNNILFAGVYATFPNVAPGPAERRLKRRVSRAEERRLERRLSVPTGTGVWSGVFYAPIWDRRLSRRGLGSANVGAPRAGAADGQSCPVSRGIMPPAGGGLQNFQSPMTVGAPLVGALRGRIVPRRSRRSSAIRRPEGRRQAEDRRLPDVFHANADWAPRMTGVADGAACFAPTRRTRWAGTGSRDHAGGPPVGDSLKLPGAGLGSANERKIYGAPITRPSRQFLGGSPEARMSPLLEPPTGKPAREAPRSRRGGTSAG